MSLLGMDFLIASYILNLATESIEEMFQDQNIKIEISCMGLSTILRGVYNGSVYIFTYGEGTVQRAF